MGVFYRNPFTHSISGREVKDWIRYQILHKTSYSSLAERMNKFYNLNDNKIYRLEMQDNAPVATEIKEEGVDH